MQHVARLAPRAGDVERAPGDRGQQLERRVEADRVAAADVVGPPGGALGERQLRWVGNGCAVGRGDFPAGRGCVSSHVVLLRSSCATKAPYRVRFVAQRFLTGGAWDEMPLSPAAALRTHLLPSRR